MFQELFECDDNYRKLDYTSLSSLRALLTASIYATYRKCQIVNYYSALHHVVYQIIKLICIIYSFYEWNICTGVFQEKSCS